MTGFGLRGTRTLWRIALWAVAAAFLSPGAFAQKGEPAPVTVAAASRAAIVEPVPLTGTVTSPRTAMVSTAVAGLVEALAVEEGDRVGRGAVLAQLDTALEELALARTIAAVEEAEAAKAEAERRLGRANRLTASVAISREEVAARRTELRIAAARLKQLQAERAAQAERIARHTIRAPFAGVVARKMAEAGEWLAPGTALVELVATGGLRIDAQVPQRYFPRIDESTEAEVRLDAVPSRRLAARVGALVPVSDETARTFTAHLWLEETGLPLTPGMSAHLVLRLRAAGRDVVIPHDALVRYPDGRTTVWAVVPGEEAGIATVREARIETGLVFDGRVQVLAGLEAGTMVVVEGNEALRDGQQVRIGGGM